MRFYFALSKNSRTFALDNKTCITLWQNLAACNHTQKCYNCNANRECKNAKRKRITTVRQR